MSRVARAIRDGRSAHREAIKVRMGWWDDLILCVVEGLTVIAWCFTMQDEERT